MGWTNANESTPQGDFGQGAANNDVGWGQLAINAIGVGMAHALSWGHAITNLVGSIAALTPGFDIYFPSNDTEPLNTANQINGTSGGGSFISFADLTGVTITSTVGTGVLTKSGNDLEVTTTGYIRKIILDNNGTEEVYIISEGVGFIIWDENLSDNFGALNGFTWTLGVDTAIIDGTQTALKSVNNYDYNETMGASISIPSDTPTTNLEVTMLFPISTDTASRSPLSGVSASNDRIHLLAVSGLIRTRIGGANHDITDLSLFDGKVHTIKYTPNGADIDVYFDDVFDSTFVGVSLFAITQVAGAATRTPVNLVINIDVDGTQYNTLNDWQGGIKSVAFPKIVIPEDTTNLLNDVLGQPINRPLLTNGYSFLGQDDANKDSVVVPNYISGNGFTIQGWVTTQTLEGGQSIAGDDQSIITLDASGFLKWTYNGASITSTTQITGTTSKWYRIVLRSLGAGTGEILIGDMNGAPVSETIGAIGVAAAASNTFLVGNIDGLGISQNGYNTQFSMHPFNLSDAEYTNDWNVTLPDVATSQSGFPFTLPFLLT